MQPPKDLFEMLEFLEDEFYHNPRIRTAEDEEIGSLRQRTKTSNRKSFKSKLREKENEHLSRFMNALPLPIEDIKPEKLNWRKKKRKSIGSKSTSKNPPLPEG